MATITERTRGNPYEVVGASIIDESLTRARGRHRPYCVSERPQRAYYVSNLSPTHGRSGSREFINQIKPSAITLEFKPEPLERTLNDVRIEFDVYIPSVPTYDEYQEILDRSRRAADLKRQGGPRTGDDGEEEAASETDSNELYDLTDRFFRRVCIDLTVDLDLTDPSGSAANATRAIRDATRDAIAATLDQDGVIATRGRPDPEDYDELDLTDLSRAEFEGVIEDLPKLDPRDDAFDWDVALGADTNPETGEAILRLMNRPVGADSEEEGPDEPYVFNPRIEVESRMNRYDFDLTPEDYRFDQHIWSKGRNCSTTVETIDEDDDEYRVSTTATPTSPVYEFQFNDEYDTRFAALAGDVSGVDPIEVLEAIDAGMAAYHDDWLHDRRDAFVDEYGEEAPEMEEFERAAAFFDAERDGFREGLRVLREQPDVRRAFELMNRVNYRVHYEMTPEGRGFDSWRLFQLVFIVKNLPSIVAHDPAEEYQQYADDERDERAEVLWFPTGGGKTEAYLGLVLFNLFFDRMRGKDNGVTAWIRFPLRLLSRQQKQRFLTAMLVAEDIRQTDENAGGLGDLGKPFSLGYFPGSHDSPNDIGKNNRLDQDYAAAATNDRAREKLEDDCHHIDECPLCGSDVTVRYSESENSVYHHCTGDALDDGETCIDRLPFYVVDHDIYRYTPSVLLGSLDKIAVAGMQPLFTNLLGNFTTRCPVHGLGYSDRCPEKHLCDHDDGSAAFEEVEPGTRDPSRREEVEFFDPIPSLHLVDEVHLLNEELGTFASHYETLYLALCRAISEERDADGEVVVEGVAPKVLCSTATIEEYERQMEMLFQKKATRFPEEGPKLGETFYGELDYDSVERQYTGLTPNNRTHLYAVLDLVKQYHEVIRDYYDTDAADLATELDLDPTEFDEDTKEAVLDLYETSLVYFTNKRESHTYRKNIEKQINDEMENDGYAVPLEAQQLTADTRDDDTLPRLEREGEFEDADFEDRIDTVPATSFVGHGIDVDRFNFMLFFGYPSQTFQYIQASSRVGRQSGVPGNILDVFRPFDKRDRHRYKYFEKLHEYLTRTVEPVPIDRWAKFGIERTFPGVLMAILIQYYRPLLYRKRDPDGSPAMVDVKKSGGPERINLQSAKHLYEVMDNNDRFPELTKDTMAEFLAEAYCLDNGFYTNEYFRERVSQRLDRIWNHWRNKLKGSMDTPEFPPDDQPMRSLRDIGKGYKITAFTDNLDYVEALERA